jgi:hypothetical protein
MNQLIQVQSVSLIGLCDGIGKAMAIIVDKPSDATIFDVGNQRYYKEKFGELLYFHEEECCWLMSVFSSFDELFCGIRIHALIIEILEYVIADAKEPAFVRGTLVQHRETHWLKSYPVVAVEGDTITVQGFIPRFHKSELEAVGYEVLPPKVKSYFNVRNQQLLALEELEYEWALQNGLVEVANPVPDIIKLPLKDGFGCEGGYVHTDAELSQYQSSHNLLSVLPVFFWPGLLAFSFAAGLFHWWPK